MLIGLQVWRMLLPNLKGSTDTLGPARDLSPRRLQSVGQGIEVNDENSAIIEFWSSNSSSETTAFAYKAGTTKKVAKRFEEQTRVQREQFDMIQTLQESINTLKLLKDKKETEG